MIKAYYGPAKNPVRSYYNSCSTGGRQGLLEAQRYPQDFDGLVIGAPVHYLSHITQRGVWERQALASDPWTATGGTILPKLSILAATVMAKCDAIDGLADGLIDDPRKCTFNPLTDLTACEGDVDGATCFTKAQREIIKKIYSGPPGLAFSPKYPSHAWSAEEMVPGAIKPDGTYNLPSSNWAGWVVPSPYTPTAVSRGFDLGAGWVQWVGLPLSGKGGPTWDWSLYSWTGGDPQLVVANTSPMCDAIDPNLWPVKARGAKIIHYDGWPDPATGAFMTEKNYDEVLHRMGDAHTKDFYKLYMVPGMGHCGGGTGCGTVDWQTYLENWVERGVEPEAVVGSRTARGNPADPNNYMTARTRPLCPYPEVARYLGTGSIDDAANFTCVKAVPAHVRIEPETLNLNKNGAFTAFITLPHHRDCDRHHRGHGRHDGDRDWRDLQVQAVVCEGAKGKLVKKGDTYIAKFDAEDLISVPTGKAVTFTVSLIAEHDGEQVAFEGSDTVRVK
jgi:feruloyl esterase